MFKGFRKFRVLEVEFDENIESAFYPIHDKRVDTFQEALRTYEKFRCSSDPGPGKYRVINMIDRYNVLVYQTLIQHEG